VRTRRMPSALAMKDKFVTYVNDLARMEQVVF
jgi:hypothetical protein